MMEIGFTKELNIPIQIRYGIDGTQDHRMKTLLSMNDTSSDLVDEAML
jgi:hypothetical protein